MVAHDRIRLTGPLRNAPRSRGAFYFWARRWPGRWGRSDGGLIPGEQASPRGPAFQADGPWRDPAAYARRARSCGSGAPSRPAAITAAAIAAIAALAALALARTWHWRKRSLDPRSRRAGPR